MTNKKFKKILINEINYFIEKGNYPRVILLDKILIEYSEGLVDYITYCNKIKEKNKFINITTRYLSKGKIYD